MYIVRWNLQTIGGTKKNLAMSVHIFITSYVDGV